MEQNKQMKKAFTLIEFLIVAVIVGAVLAAVMFVLKPTAENFTQSNAIKSEFTSIQNALSQYYSNTNKYPKSGWNWNENEAYLPQDIIDKGWKYECSDNEIKITTPEINNPKIIVKAFKALGKIVKNENPNSSVTKNGNSLVIVIPDKICEK